VPALRTAIAAVALATVGVDIGVAVSRSGDSSSPPLSHRQLILGPHSAPTAPCAQIKASKVAHPPTPSPATLLKPLHFPAFGITLRPSGNPGFVGASAGLIWHKWRADGVVERLASYRVFLARVTDRGALNDQLSWVVLQRGVATPDPLAPSKCTINGNELDIYDAMTGKPEAVAAGAATPDPFSKAYDSWWRLAD